MQQSGDQTQPSPFNAGNVTSALDVAKKTYQSPKQIQLHRNLPPGWF